MRAEDGGAGTPAIAAPWRDLIRHRRLLRRLLVQDIRTSYARTLLGFYWIVFLPVLYTLVFIGVRFVAFERGAGDWVANAALPATTAISALAIASGLIVFWVASETLTRSPAAIRQNTALVTDIRFPVEILPWGVVGLAVFNLVVRLGLLLVAHAALVGVPPWTAVLAPLTVLPLVVIMLGVAYAFAAIGVFLADLGFAVQILMTALLLLSGVLFPLTLVPEPYQTLLYLNPIAQTIEQFRAVVIAGVLPNTLNLLAMLLIGLVLAATAHRLFQRLRPRFNDAL